MRKLLLLLTVLLAGASGAWATDVTVIDKTQAATTYGSLSGSTFTTNASSGMAGVTVDGFSTTTATDFAYGVCLGFSSNVSSGTITLTAPSGYIITGYSFTARSNQGANPFTITPSAGGSEQHSTTGGVEVSATGLDAQTATFTYAKEKNDNKFYVTGFTITVVTEGATLVNVTYGLYESDGTTLVNSVVKSQEANSAVDVPTSLTSSPVYSYTTQGTIGNSDCTIKVIRTLIGALTTADLSNSKCYTIRTIDRGWWVVTSGATQVTSTTNASLAPSASDSKQQFAFVYYDDTEDDANYGYYLYSVSEGKFISKSGTYTTLTDKPGDKATLLASSGSSDYPTVVALNGGANHAGISNGFTPAVITNYNDLTDDGNRCAIVEAASFDATDALAVIDDYFHPTHTITYVVKDESNNTLFTSNPVGAPLGTSVTSFPDEYKRDYFYTYGAITPVTITAESAANTNVEVVATAKSGVLQYTADATSPIYYNLNIRSKYLVYDDEATGDVTLQTTSSAFNPDAAWAFIGDPYTGFKIINQTNGTDKFLTYTSVVTGRNGGNNNITFVSEASFTDQYWIVDANTGGFCLRMKNNTDIYFHHDNTNNFLRTCSKGEYGSVHNDAGSTLTFSSDEAVLQDLYDALNGILGSGVGKYTYSGSSMTQQEALANITGAGQALSIHATSMYATLYAALQDIQANITLNAVTSGFYRIKGATSGKYLASGLAASNSKFNMTTAEDASTIFYYDGTKLVNYGSGKSNGVDKDKWSWVNEADASEVVFHDGHNTIGGYGIQTATAYFYDNGDGSSSADRGTGVNMTSGNARYRSWQLTAITTLPVTVSDAGYATLYSPVALTIPSGVKAYYVSALSETEATLTEIKTTIPATTPVILKAAADSYDFATTTGGTDVSASNKLSGTLGGVAVAEGVAYTLQKNVAGDAVGLFPKAAGDIAGFKAYMLATQLPSSGGEVKGVTFRFDGTDGINAMQMVNAESTMYNLAGQRVSKAAKGIYIVNGKKVAVK